MITNQEYLETVKSMRKRTTRLEREGDFWTQEEREKLSILFDSGAGLTDIAKLWLIHSCTIALWENAAVQKAWGSYPHQKIKMR